ncbi:MAG TPA: DNA recombination protein RmuC [Mycobacteriales bacterium]|nr:DNA recombination protein RmuC [Mycobacteriales bacterium]
MVSVLALLAGLAVGYALAHARTAGLRAQLHAAELSVAQLRAGDADLARSQQALASLVEPLTQQLGRVEGQIHQLEVARAATTAELRQQVTTVAAGSEQLSRETRALVDALRRPQARGRWGELHLRKVVEHAGMLDRCDFLEQATLTTDDGVLRPDLVVRLPGQGSVVVDAKVSLAAFLEAAETDDPQHRSARLAAHARHLRQHVDRLADKQYWSLLPETPDFVVLFVPTEAILSMALDADPTLFEHAMARRVHLATPVTLLTMLRTAAYSWQQHELAGNAQQVFAAGKELFAKLATFGGHVDKLGRALTSAVTAYNTTVGSLERMVLPSARRMSELGLQGEVPEPRPVEEVVRPVAAPHLVALPETG